MGTVFMCIKNLEDSTQLPDFAKVNLTATSFRACAIEHFHKRLSKG